MGTCKTRAIQADLGVLTHNTYSGIISHTLELFKHIQANSQSCVNLACPESWYTEKQRHIQNPVKHFYGYFCKQLLFLQYQLSELSNATSLRGSQ